MNWLKKLAGRASSASLTGVLVEPSAPTKGPTFKADFAAPAFSTRLAVDSPGAPGQAGAEALYRKWADRWQEF